MLMNLENKIDFIFALEDGSKYMIIDQGNCQGKAYYLANRLDTLGNLSNVVAIFCLEDNQNLVPVGDSNLLRELEKYFSSRLKESN